MSASQNGKAENSLAKGLRPVSQHNEMIVFGEAPAEDRRRAKSLGRLSPPTPKEMLSLLPCPIRIMCV